MDTANQRLVDDMLQAIHTVRYARLCCTPKLLNPGSDECFAPAPTAVAASAAAVLHAENLRAYQIDDRRRAKASWYHSNVLRKPKK